MQNDDIILDRIKEIDKRLRNLELKFNTLVSWVEAFIKLNK